MNNFVINGTLCPQHRDAGLTLVENEDFVELQHPDEKEPIARFSAKGVTIEEIHKEADKYIGKQTIKRWKQNG